MTILNDTGFPSEVPCSRCGWPLYCCLCSSQDEQASEIAALLGRLDQAPLECDGLTRAAHTILNSLDIAHQVKFGQIEHAQSGRRFYSHFWIELESGYLIDYRARMWLGDAPDMPHGVFRPAEYGVIYGGETITINERSSLLYCLSCSNVGRLSSLLSRSHSRPNLTS